MKIYTKTGDQGETGLYGGKRVSKNSSYLEAYGSVDELNAWLGLIASTAQEERIRADLLQVQHDLHALSADLASPHDQEGVERFQSERTERLERWIDECEKDLPPLKNFILAGGSELAGRLHVARTICRRAEREIVAHAQEEKINDEAIRYINRLSDALFVFARFANQAEGVEDVLWDKSR